jgi:Kef-type K+ transport system membrane component KefB
MNEILSVGLILVAALIAGHAAQLIRLPEVIGYLLVGVLIGPSALDLVSHENVRTLGFLSEVALGVILFGIGSIFEADNFRRVGRGVVRIALAETTAVFVLVMSGMLLSGLPFAVALLLGQRPTHRPASGARGPQQHGRSAGVRPGCRRLDACRRRH